MTRTTPLSYRIIRLILSGALTMGMASCGGKTGAKGASGGSENMTGDGDGDDSGSSASGGREVTSGDGDGDKGSGGESGDGDGDGDTTSNGDGSGGKESGDGDGDGSGGSSNNNANPGVKTLGDSCTNPGALACAGENQKLQLLCDGSGEWVQNGTCAGIAVCDTGEGNRGSCQEPIEGCDAPSDEFCDETALRECGVDRLGGALLEGCCSRGTVLAQCCPEPGIGIFDCSEDCENKSTACLAGANSMCTYLTEISAAKLPTIVRTPAGEDICPIAQSDGCQEEFFAIYFADSSRSYRVEMPEGMMAAGGPMFTGQDSWSSPCSAREDGWLNTSGCFTVRPLTEDEGQNPTFSGTGVIVNVPFGGGGRNLSISEGECPE